MSILMAVAWAQASPMPRSTTSPSTCSSQISREMRTPGHKRRTESCVALTAPVVLVAASLVGSAQGYDCTPKSQCQYEGCQNRGCE